MDLRGAGAGAHLARKSYHSALSEDLRAVVEYLDKHFSGSPVTGVGFSLGGNLVLKLLVDLGDAVCGGLDSAMAVCPPINLALASNGLRRFFNRFYDKHFVQHLLKQLRNRSRLRTDIAIAPFPRQPRGLRELDEFYTAPVAGFRSVEEYYEVASVNNRIDQITRPTWIVAAVDDPIVPVSPFKELPEHPSVKVTLTQHGGHLGYLGQRGTDPDRHWIDWRIVDWVLALPSKATGSVANLAEAGS